MQHSDNDNERLRNGNAKTTTQKLTMHSKSKNDNAKNYDTKIDDAFQKQERQRHISVAKHLYNDAKNDDSKSDYKSDSNDEITCYCPEKKKLVPEVRTRQKKKH